MDNFAELYKKQRKDCASRCIIRNCGTLTSRWPNATLPFQDPSGHTGEFYVQHKKNTHLSELIQQTSLIIWDEAPVNHRHCFEALDRTLRDILSDINPNAQDTQFGGITFVLGGDFRQTLPVIQNSTKQQILKACIVNSYLWRKCTVLQLTENMRLDSRSLSPSNREELRMFAEWLLRVGSGIEPYIQIQNEANYIKIPQSLLLPQECRDLDGLIILCTHLGLIQLTIIHPIFVIAQF